MTKRTRTALWVVAGLALLVLAVLPIRTISIKVDIPPPAAETAK